MPFERSHRRVKSDRWPTSKKLTILLILSLKIDLYHVLIVLIEFGDLQSWAHWRPVRSISSRRSLWQSTRAELEPNHRALLQGSNRSRGSSNQVAKGLTLNKSLINHPTDLIVGLFIGYCWEKTISDDFGQKTKRLVFFKLEIFILN